jgi:hypothetical protein
VLIGRSLAAVLRAVQPVKCHETVMSFRGWRAPDQRVVKTGRQIARRRPLQDPDPPGGPIDPN